MSVVIDGGAVRRWLIPIILAGCVRTDCAVNLMQPGGGGAVQGELAELAFIHLSEPAKLMAGDAVGDPIIDRRVDVSQNRWTVRGFRNGMRGLSASGEHDLKSDEMKNLKDASSPHGMSRA